jgi:hypothetical protein
MMTTEVALTDWKVNVKGQVQLRGDDPDSKLWPLYYPQYIPSTAIPFIEIQDKLILTGLAPFSIADSLIDRFRFMACIDMKTNKAEFVHTYPEELYGRNSNWDGGDSFTPVYPALSATGELVHSFPVSHDLYLSRWDAEAYKTVYSGSNVAKTIRSIDWEPNKAPRELVKVHYLQQDIYAAILYDSYRKVYYRFMLQGIPDATEDMAVNEKPVIVIMMDDQFTYLGETLLGKYKEWNWKNSFVTPEGLAIEYIDDEDIEEQYLNLKLFAVEKL